MPPFSRDALNSHLVLPGLWRQHGLLWRDPWLAFTAYPPLADLPYLLFAHRPWDILASCWHATGALATLLLLDRSMRNTGASDGARRWTALLWSTMPTVVALCGWAYVDLWLCAATAAAVAVITRPTIRAMDGWWLGLALGAALLIKYNAAAVAIAAWLGIGWRLAPDPRLLWAVVWRALLTPMLLAGWWYAVNLLQLGGPFYPLGVANPPAIGPVAFRELAYHEPHWWALLAPLRAFFYGETNNPRLFDGMLTPLPLVALFGWRLRDRRMQALALAALCYLAFAVTTAIRARYLLPATLFMLPPAMQLLEESPKRWMRVLLPAASLAWSLAVDGRYLMWLAPWDYWLHGRDTFLARHLPDYPLQRWAARHLPRNARLLLILTGGRGYYLQRDFRFRMGDEGSPPTAAEIRSFDYLLIRQKSADRLYDGNPNWRRLRQRLCPVARSGRFTLWRNRPCSDKERPEA